MMAFHDIHSCSKIVSENIELKMKIKFLLNRKKELEQELEALKSSSGNYKNVFSKSDACVQTDFKSWIFSQSVINKKREEPKETLKDTDVLKINKVVDMHTQLLKRYDKEVKINMSYADTISDLNVRLSEAEDTIRAQKQKIMNLERDLLLWKAKQKSGNYKALCEGDSILREVVTERNKLVSENEFLKKELSGLDANFFEEVEDIRYALVQSSKLNKEYERILKNLCKQYGAPCPTPEMILKNT